MLETTPMMFLLTKGGDGNGGDGNGGSDGGDGTGGDGGTGTGKHCIVACGEDRNIVVSRNN